MKCTPEDHPDLESLTKAHGKLSHLVSVVNENSREANNLKRLKEISEALGSSDSVLFFLLYFIFLFFFDYLFISFNFIHYYYYYLNYYYYYLLLLKLLLRNKIYLKE